MKVSESQCKLLSYWVVDLRTSYNVSRFWSISKGRKNDIEPVSDNVHCDASDNDGVDVVKLQNEDNSVVNKTLMYRD